MQKKSKIIIIIASYNGQEYWSDLMGLLSKERYDDFDLEILVVDNNSSDASVEYIESRYPDIKIIKNRICWSQQYWL